MTPASCTHRAWFTIFLDSFCRSRCSWRRIATWKCAVLKSDGSPAANKCFRCFATGLLRRCMASWLSRCLPKEVADQEGRFRTSIPQLGKSSTAWLWL